jgi:DNA-binding transcriptional regulator GbsR (MarR family)
MVNSDYFTDMSSLHIGELHKSTGVDSLLPVQKEMAAIFADLADLFGNPTSLGSIYGLLFASPDPLSMEEIVMRLGISAGTASQGLRRLTELEAILPEKSDGERLTRYSARLELRPFVSIFLKQQLMPRLERSSGRLAELDRNLPDLAPDEREILKIRIGRASKWHRRAKTFLPLIRRFLG